MVCGEACGRTEWRPVAYLWAVGGVQLLGAAACATASGSKGQLQQLQWVACLLLMRRYCDMRGSNKVGEAEQCVEFAAAAHACLVLLRCCRAATHELVFTQGTAPAQEPTTVHTVLRQYAVAAPLYPVMH